MKKLTKIFVAVAALFVGFACTTDVTEDLGVNVGGKSTLCISLEESRTQLGEKAEGVYPLLWSEGDQLAVNGVASLPLTAQQANASGAVFTFDNDLTYPLSIIYPAPSEAGTVTFLANQEYTAGTFCANAAPMYGYAKTQAEGEEATPIQLRHLTGVLRFAVKGSVSLASAVVTSDNGDLAGTYALDCSKGTLTPQEGTTSKQIVLSFGEGLALNAAEATPFYVTVPTGSYGGVQVRLTTTDGKIMVVKFSSYGDKAIKAGTVREFSEFEFVENAVDADDEGVYEIYTLSDLQHFAKIAPVFTPRTEAKLMANIVIPEGTAWTPIEGFTQTFNGNNFSIDGLTAPLFGHSEAKIHDLTLTNVAIAISDETYAGAFAKLINNGALTNCSAEGTLTYTKVTAAGSFVGGLVGYMSNSEFNNNTNRINITANGTITASEDSLLRVGGVAGLLLKPTTKVEKCKNYGTILFTGDLDRIQSGALIAHCGSTAELEDCHNEGEMLLQANLQGAAYSLVTGLIGVIDYEVDNSAVFKAANCTNRGAIIYGDKGGESVTPTVGQNVATVHLAGIFGYTRGVTTDTYYTLNISNCTNHANIEVNAVSASSNVKMSGLMSQLSVDTTISNCHNYGNLYAYQGVKKAIYMAGLVSHILAEKSEPIIKVTECTNNGEIYASAKIQHDNTPYYGGISSFVEGATKAYYSKVYNNGKLNFNSLATGSNMVYTGGVIGYVGSAVLEFSLTDSGNTGELIYAHSLSETRRNIYSGGIIGHIGAKSVLPFKNVTNSGNITSNGASDRYFVAGLVSSTATDLTLENCSNSGNITAESKQAHESTYGWIAGLTGVILEATGVKTITMTSCSNSGNITVKNSKYVSQLAVGGISAQMPYYGSNKYCGTMNMIDCSNTGDILVQDVSAAVSFSVGGILSANSKLGYANIQAPVQSGNITVSISGDHTVVNTTVGGIIGAMENGVISKNASGKRGSVSGQIKVTSHGEAANQWHAVAGVAAFVPENGVADISDVDLLAANNGCVSLEMNPATCNTYVAGITGYVGETSVVSFKNIVNGLAVSYKVDTQNTASCLPYVSGGVGRSLAAVTMDNCTNNGDITVEGTKMTQELDLGGLCACVHTAHGKYSNLINNGNILVKKGDGTCGALYIGGIAGGQMVTANDTNKTNHFTNCTNNGSITLAEGLATTGKSVNIRLGGCFAWVKQSYDENIRNNGDIYIHAKTTGSNSQMLLGGVYGYNAASTNSDMVGGYINTGDIVVTGGAASTSTNAFGSAIGGIVGAFYGNISNAVNVGNITFTGSSNVAKSSVGGILGFSQAAGIISNCKHYGKIKACIITQDGDKVSSTPYTNVGAITGSTRVEKTGGAKGLTAVVRDCQLGGTICTAVAHNEDTWETADVEETIDSTNFMNYIYGVAVDWSSITTNYDGCSALTSAPKVD